MDGFNRWLSAWLDTPAGSILVPLAMILARCLMTALSDRHQRRKHRKHKKQVLS